MLFSNDQKIVKIICYSFDSCEKMVATKFDSYHYLHGNHIPNNCDFFMTYGKNHEAYSKWIYFFGIIGIDGLTKNVQYSYDNYKKNEFLLFQLEQYLMSRTFDIILWHCFMTYPESGRAFTTYPGQGTV